MQILGGPTCHTKTQGVVSRQVHGSEGTYFAEIPSTFCLKLTPVAASNLLLSPTKSDSRWFGIDSCRLAVSSVCSGTLSLKASVLISSLYWFRERGRRPTSRNVKIRTWIVSIPSYSWDFFCTQTTEAPFSSAGFEGMFWQRCTRVLGCSKSENFEAAQFVHPFADAKKGGTEDCIVAETGKRQERTIIAECATWILCGWLSSFSLLSYTSIGVRWRHGAPLQVQLQHIQDCQADLVKWRCRGGIALRHAASI